MSRILQRIALLMASGLSITIKSAPQRSLFMIVIIAQTHHTDYHTADVQY